VHVRSSTNVTIPSFRPFRPPFLTRDGSMTRQEKNRRLSPPVSTFSPRPLSPVIHLFETSCLRSVHTRDHPLRRETSFYRSPAAIDASPVPRAYRRRPAQSFVNLKTVEHLLSPSCQFSAGHSISPIVSCLVSLLTAVFFSDFGPPFRFFLPSSFFSVGISASPNYGGRLQLSGLALQIESANPFFLHLP